MCSEPWEVNLLMMMNQGTPEETPGLCCVLKMLTMLLRCVEQFMSSEMFFFLLSLVALLFVLPLDALSNYSHTVLCSCFASLKFHRE